MTTPRKPRTPATSAPRPRQRQRTTPTVRSEEAPVYAGWSDKPVTDAAPPDRPGRSHEDSVIKEAQVILLRRLRARSEPLTSPHDAQTYLQLRLATYPYEVFACLWLDNRHRVLDMTEMFRGTLDGATVHPREVAREALAQNAAAVILAHNHPSSMTEPSAADRGITRELTAVLHMIGVRVLDHIVVGCGGCTSFAERGLL